MFLTGRELKERISVGKIRIDPFDDGELSPYGYYIHCGDEIWTEKIPHTTSSSHVFQDVDTPYRQVKVNGSFIIPPHRAVIVSSLETVYISPHDIGIPTPIPTDPRRPPLIIQPPILHPSWGGKILFTVFNPTPYRVRISVGERMFLLSFQKL